MYPLPYAPLVFEEMLGFLRECLHKTAAKSNLTSAKYMEKLIAEDAQQQSQMDVADTHASALGMFRELVEAALLPNTGAYLILFLFVSLLLIRKLRR